MLNQLDKKKKMIAHEITWSPQESLCDDDIHCVTFSLPLFTFVRLVYACSTRTQYRLMKPTKALWKRLESSCILKWGKIKIHTGKIKI